MHEENKLINEIRVETVLNPETFIQRIAETHSVFTRRDIERLVFKTFQKTHHTTDYLQVVAQILEHHEVIKLGGNEQGVDSYTTRKQYIEEGKLLDHVEHLSTRKNHVVHQNLEQVIEQHQLNEEQAQSMQFIIQGNDISVLIGRPGVGKSYLLKPLKELYENEGYTVLGASLSGKVAKMLEAETGIQASTIASLTYRLKTEQLSLTKQHVLIIDEAGMVDFNNLAYLLKAVDEAGAKIILVGDPDQLKPIHKGEIDWPLDFALRVGFDSDSLVGKAINYIAKATTAIKDKWSYIVNYEAYVQAQGVKKQLQEQQAVRAVARSVANLMDESQDLKQRFKLLEKEAKQKNLNAYHLPEFDTLYTRSLERDKQATLLVSTQLKNIEKMAQSSKFMEKIKSYSARYARFQTLEAIAKSSHSEDSASLICEHSTKIDLSKDYPHIVHIASRNKISMELIHKKILAVQQKVRQRAWDNLCKKYPIVTEYEKVTEQSSKTQGYHKEQYQKVIRRIAERIIKDAFLVNQLKLECPTVVKEIEEQVRANVTHENFQ